MAFSNVGIAFPAPRRVTFLSVIYFFFWFLSRFVFLYFRNCRGLRQVSSLSNIGYPFFALILAHHRQSPDFIGNMSGFWNSRDDKA